MKETINIIFGYDFSEITAARNRILSYVEILKDNYNINLFVLSKSNEKFKYDGIEIYSVFYSKIEKNNFIKRAVDEINFSIKLIKKANSIKSDFTLITSPSIFLIPIGVFIKNKKVLDIRDLVWEYLTNKIIKSIFRLIVYRSLSFYDQIIVTNKYEKNLLKKYNPIIISNGITNDKYDILLNLRYNKPERFNITYIGNIGLAQNLLILCKVAMYFNDVQFNIVGDGADFEKINRFIKENKLKNIKLYGALKWDEILQIYENSSVLFAQLDKSFKMAMPSKLYEYASTGLPIIYGGNGIARDFVYNLENGFVFDSGNIDELKNVIESIKEKNFSLSIQNRNLIKNNFIRENNADKILSIFDNLKGKK